MASDDDTTLPASIETAWGLRERPRKGPKRGLNLEQIVVAAVSVAEADGLAAVSMNRVADELGASTMSLYRYVAAKDELLKLMADAAYGAPPPAPERGEDWRAGLADWARTYLARLRLHPWVIRIHISGPPITPNEVAWMEAGLNAMRATNMTEGEKISVIVLLSGFVRNRATLDADVDAAIQTAGSTPAEAMSSYGRLIAKLTDPQRFPAIRRVIAAGVFDTIEEPDDQFGFGLARILDGVETLTRTRRRSERATNHRKL